MACWEPVQHWVWEDNWIPDGDRLVTPTCSLVQNADMLVAELIDHENSCWNINALSNCFDPTTVNAILSLPLSNRWPVDNLFWWRNMNGIYSVKSGYWLGMLGIEKQL